jgi:DNA-binding MurR/RpiR family transcriptional regulator
VSAAPDTQDEEPGAPDLSRDLARDLPRDLKSLRQWIMERHASLPRRLVQVAEFTLRQPEEIAFGTLAEIAAQADVQPSTLVRFAQALGYSGFSDLQAVFRAHARERWPDYRERLLSLGEAPSGNAEALLHRFLNASLTSIERLRDGLDPEALEAAVQVLAHAGTVAVLGSRRAFPLAAYCGYALRKLGMRCELVDQVGGMGAEQVALLQPDDVLLAISFTPYTPVTVEHAAGASRRGVKVVAITDTPFSPLVPLATVWLEVAEADHAGFRSVAGSFALATALAVAAAGRREAERPG